MKSRWNLLLSRKHQGFPLFRGCTQRANVGRMVAAVHRIRRVLRTLSPGAATTVIVALVLGGTGLASAANGGSFILGQANKESAVASLSSTKGTPLSLVAPAGKAPLAVNRNTMVKNLNAQFTGGLTSTQLKVTGGDGIARPNSNTPIDRTLTVVARTGKLPAGTYYVTATALLNVAAGDKSGFCVLSKASDDGLNFGTGGEDHEGFVQAAETAAVAVKTGEVLEEICQTNGTNGSHAFNAGIIAIRILSSHGTPPA
jgi:hypothetical protein